MNKFADIFTENGVPYPMTIKNVDRGVTTKFGTSTVILADHEGEEFKWFVDDDKFARTFPEDVFNGDKITVTKKQHPKNATWAYYSTQIVERSPNAKTPEQRQERKAEGAKDRDVTQYRMGLAGVTQALLSSGKFKTESDEDVEALFAKAKAITSKIRTEAEKMYDEDKAKEAEDVFSV